MKQAILVRMDLQLPKGKLASQVAHASVESVLKSSKEKVEAWHEEGMAKIILKVSDVQVLKQYHQKAKAAKLVAVLITDAGKTVFNGNPTITCVGIGPDEDEKVDKVVHDLKLL